MPSVPQKSFYSVSEAAKILNASVRSVQDWIKSGYLKARRLNPYVDRSKYIIYKSDLEQFIKKRQN